MRLALFGGVYSNHLALSRVLAEIGTRDVDATWCLGDLGGFGPHPDRSVERMRASGIPMLRGNLDDSIGHALADCACGYSDPRDNHFAQRSYDYALAHTSSSNREWLRERPEHARLELAGRRVLLCHGSPRRVNEFLWNSTCSDAFLEWLCEAHEADVIACTHSGLPWHRVLPSGRAVVNVGVIGRPANDGDPRGVWSELDFGSDVVVRFHRVAYDHEALAREMEAESLPAEFVETIRTGWWTTCLENVPAKERRAGRW
ncbi:MAG: metallophosphoesterase [Candidatus Eisenbacteria bacterium]|uniref:Metallophosphoesterase n=1 Tax=Eiseniibacteriota bacterium TaxID=2212470 RepID=A0A849SI83_UNCEI|nr:metallophosphoesterase [Candidatus Eisenbacteria bacterium]